MPYRRQFHLNFFLFPNNGQTDRDSVDSACSEDEKERLSEIQQFLNKEIEVIKLGKKDYARTLEVTQKNISTDVMALVADHEAWLKAKKRKPSVKK